MKPSASALPWSLLSNPELGGYAARVVAQFSALEAAPVLLDGTAEEIHAGTMKRRGMYIGSHSQVSDSYGMIYAAEEYDIDDTESETYSLGWYKISDYTYISSNTVLTNASYYNAQIIVSAINSKHPEGIQIDGYHYRIRLPIDVDNFNAKDEVELGVPLESDNTEYGLLRKACGDNANKMHLRSRTWFWTQTHPATGAAGQIIQRGYDLYPGARTSDDPSNKACIRFILERIG